MNRIEAVAGYRRENVVWPTRAQGIISQTEIEDYAAERIFVPKGRRLITEGAPNTSVYLQLTGWTCLECVGEHGERVVMDFLISGDFLGLDSEASTSPVTVTALTDVAVLRIDRQRMRQMIDSDSRFLDAYMKSVQANADRSRRHRIALCSKSASARVCRVLLDLAERLDGAREGGERPTNIPISQVLLACAVDLTPVAVNRIVQGLRRERVLEWDGSGLVVRDLDRLRALA